MEGIESGRIRKVYLIGIGGIGMSALARYFQIQGMEVAGYDKTPTRLTDALSEEGITVVFDDNEGAIPEAFSESSATTHTMVIYTPAIPAANPQINFFRNAGFQVKKRSTVLGEITKSCFTIAVAGTHGKTTTSSMIAYLLRESGIECSAFLGGISVNYNSNLLTGGFHNGKKVMVVEADEYDRSFLTLYPDISVITSMDADHLDIYGNKEYMDESYRLFAMQLKPGGMLICRKGLPLNTSGTHKEYSAIGDADYSATGIKILDHKYHFNWKNSRNEIRGLIAGIPGLHNVENAVAAIAVARKMGAGEEAIRKAVEGYRGVHRRFEYRINRPGCVYIDDYAHHPEEIRACIESVKALYPGGKITGIFQPHLYTRTRDFADGFAKSLEMLDDLILLDIYPAREQPIPGITSDIILDKVKLEKKMVCSKEKVLNELPRHSFNVLLTLGAGDIDTLVGPIEKMLTKS